MSDYGDDINMDGGMNGMDDDDMSDGPDGGFEPKSELPDGMQKEILKEGDGWKKPKAGDDVEVHYVGTLEKDGSQFDSSRERGSTFNFTLGKGQVIKGWDLGVATMKKGELAKLTIPAEYGYGDAGAGEKIPGGSTLVFEVELLGWTSKDDLFGDEGAIKAEIEEGKGWKKPKPGDEVVISLKTMCDDGKGIEEFKDFEYTLGETSLDFSSKTLDKALSGMKVKDKVSLTCTAPYAYGDTGNEAKGVPANSKVTAELSLVQIYETEDISFGKDKSIMKKQVKEGEGYETAKDTSKVTVKVEYVKAGDAELLPEPKTIEFTLGNGEVCDTLECVGMKMKKTEMALVTCTNLGGCDEPQLGLKASAAGNKPIIFKIEMVSFEKAKESWDMDETEKLSFASGRKDTAAKLVQGKRYALALERYRKIVDMFSYVDNMKDENKTKAKELKKACELNKALCFLKLMDHAEAKKCCSGVLKDDPMNAKALFRRAQADVALKNYPDAMSDLKKVIDADASNVEAKRLLLEAKKGQKQADAQAKGMYSKMCNAFGTFKERSNKRTVPNDMDIDDEDGDDAEPMDDESIPKKADEAIVTETNSAVENATAGGS